MFIVVMEFCFNRTVVPHPSTNIKRAEVFTISFEGVLNSVPLIIFSYMYQANIPAIYMELERKTVKRMDKVVLRGSLGAVVLYIVVGIFGYWTFSTDVSQLSENGNNEHICEIPNLG